MSKRYDKFQVNDNYGATILENVVLEETERFDCDGKMYLGNHVTGTVVGGGITSRLFSTTHYQPHKTGMRKAIDIYDRHINPPSVHGYAWHSVNVATCG